MKKIQFQTKDSMLAFVSSFIVCQLLVFFATIFGVFIGLICHFNTDQINAFFETAIGYLILTIFLDLGLILTYVFFSRKTSVKQTVKIKFGKTILYIGLSVCALLILSPIVNCFDSLLVNLNWKLNTLSYPLNTVNYLISILSLCILPAIAEELVFRGLILNGLKSKGKFFSVIITALLFAIFHMSMDQFVYPLLFGLLLSVIMYYENNILYCIIIHFTNNFVSLTLSFAGINLLFNHWTYILLACVLLIIYLILIFSFLVKIKSNKQKEKWDKIEKYYFWICLIIMLILWIAINIIKWKN